VQATGRCTELTFFLPKRYFFFLPGTPVTSKRPHSAPTPSMEDQFQSPIHGAGGLRGYNAFFSTVFDTFARQDVDSNSSHSFINHTPHFLVFNVLSWQFLGRLCR
jgi:hypothetical protein